MRKRATAPLALVLVALIAAVLVATGTGELGTHTQPALASAHFPHGGEGGGTGPTGPEGKEGKQGPTGPTGATGPEGPRGFTGTTGATGATGEKGTTGLTGPVGPVGPTGTTGATGATGAAGPEGPKGTTGTTGAEGPKGLTGTTGPEGPQGPAGATGATGPEGPKGTTGTTGATGPEGPEGAHLGVAAVTSTSGTLVTRKLTPADTTSATLNEKLPTGAAEGTPIAIEKKDGTSHEVVVEGSIRSSATTIKLRLEHETVYLIADSAGSWWPVSSHKTLSSLESILFLKTSGETLESRFESGLLKDSSLPADASTAKLKGLGTITGAVELNLEEGTTFTGTLSGNVTFTITHAPTGRPVMVKLLLKENGTGGFTWSVTSLVWGNSTPTFSTAANARNTALVEVTPSAAEIVGIVGTQGEKGETGATGPKGETGATGTGLSPKAPSEQVNRKTAETITVPAEPTIIYIKGQFTLAKLKATVEVLVDGVTIGAAVTYNSVATTQTSFNYTLIVKASGTYRVNVTVTEGALEPASEIRTNYEKLT